MALTEEWTQRWWWATLLTGPYCSGARQLKAIKLARREEHMGKEMSTEGLVFDWTRAILRPKGDESKTREDIEAEGTATTKPTRDVTITTLSISALSPFTRPLSSPSLS